MAINSGPNIIKDDSLILNFDIANIKSYRGESTINLTPDMGLIGMQDITISYIGLELGWKKYSMSGVWSGGTYPYCMYVTHSTFISGLTYSTNCYIKTNIPQKFDYYFTGMNYVNQPMNSGGTSFSKIQSDGSIWVGRIGFNYVDTTAQNGYLMSKPLSNGTTFNPNTDFVYIRYGQIEQKDHITPFVYGTRGTTFLTGDGLVNLSNTNYNCDLMNDITYDSSNMGNLIFNGTDTYLNFNKDISFHITEPWSFSIDLKLHSDMISAWRNIIGQNADTYNTWMFHPSAFALYHNYYESHTWIWYTSLTVGNSGSTLPVNKWTNITVTCTPVNSAQTYFVCYHDGIQSDSTTFTWSSDSITQYMIFNRVGGNGNRFFRGNISNVKIYNKVLTSKEVLQNYNSLKSRFR